MNLGNTVDENIRFKLIIEKTNFQNVHQEKSKRILNSILRKKGIFYFFLVRIYYTNFLKFSTNLNYKFLLK